MRELPKSDFSTFSFQVPTKGSAAQSAADITNNAGTDLKKRIVDSSSRSGCLDNRETANRVSVRGDQRYKVFGWYSVRPPQKPLSFRFTKHLLSPLKGVGFHRAIPSPLCRLSRPAHKAQILWFSATLEEAFSVPLRVLRRVTTEAPICAAVRSLGVLEMFIEIPYPPRELPAVLDMEGPARAARAPICAAFKCCSATSSSNTRSRAVSAGGRKLLRLRTYRFCGVLVALSKTHRDGHSHGKHTGQDERNMRIPVPVGHRFQCGWGTIPFGVGHFSGRGLGILCVGDAQFDRFT